MEGKINEKPYTYCNEKIIGEYKLNEGVKATMAGVTKAAAYPDLGFRSLINLNGIFLICTKFTENSKTWNAMTKTN